MNFAFMGDGSVLAAEASMCAAEQNRFWDYHDVLFANQGQYSSSSLKQYAKDLDLDTTQFNDCLDNEMYKQAVEDERALGSELGVGSTPTMIINGNLILGAKSFEEFHAIIEEALANTE
jgi:protein-disulfide isomerase